MNKYCLVYVLGDILKDKKTSEYWIVVASYCQPSVFSSDFETKGKKFAFKLLKEPKSLRFEGRFTKGDESGRKK